MDQQIHYLPFSALPKVERGHGIVNFLVTNATLGAKCMHSGITRLPVGASVPRHSHNAEEQVTVLEGRLRVSLGDQIFDCGPYDSTFITAGVPHDFANIGDKPVLVMVIYGSANPKRKFSATGEVVDIGSEKDRFPAVDPQAKSVST